MRSVARSIAVVAADTVGDPAATRTVYTTVVLLAVLGLFFIALAVWLFRRTRPDLELLAPLEEMDTRSWRRRDPATQRRLLDAVRPEGAHPVERSTSQPTLDDEFAAARPVVTFDDLAEDAVAGERSGEAGVEDATDGLDATRDGAGDDVVAVDGPDDANGVGSSDELVDELVDELADTESGDDGTRHDRSGVDDDVGDGDGDDVGDDDDDDGDDDDAADFGPPTPQPGDQLSAYFAHRVVLEPATNGLGPSGVDDTSDGPVSSGEDDGTVEIDKPAAVAHEAVLLSGGVDRIDVEDLPAADDHVENQTVENRDVEDRDVEDRDVEDHAPIVPGEGLLRRRRSVAD